VELCSTALIYHTFLTCAYSHHSSYHELCALVEAFRPRDIYACMDNKETWDTSVMLEHAITVRTSLLWRNFRSWCRNATALWGTTVCIKLHKKTSQHKMV